MDEDLASKLQRLLGMRAWGSTSSAKMILKLEFAHYDCKLCGTISAKDFALSMVASADISHIDKLPDRIDELNIESACSTLVTIFLCRHESVYFFIAQGERKRSGHPSLLNAPPTPISGLSETEAKKRKRMIGLCEGVSTRDSLHLGGYVVELALKNMEYLAMYRQYHKERVYDLSSRKAHETQTAFQFLSNQWLDAMMSFPECMLEIARIPSSMG